MSESEKDNNSPASGGKQIEFSISAPVKDSYVPTMRRPSERRRQITVAVMSLQSGERVDITLGSPALVRKILQDTVKNEDEYKLRYNKKSKTVSVWRL